MYVDVKQTVWLRCEFSNIYRKDIIQGIKDNPEITIDGILYYTNGPIEQEILYDTAENLTPEDNDGENTLEVYNDDDSLIWENGNGDSA